MLKPSAANERLLATKRLDTGKETARVFLLVVAASSVAGRTPTTITSWTSFHVSSTSHVLRQSSLPSVQSRCCLGCFHFQMAWSNW